MRILRNIVLIILPLLLMINLYRFFFMTDTYSFRGVSYLWSYIQTFPGLNNTFDVINNIKYFGGEMLSMDDPNIFETVKYGFMMLFYVCVIPVSVVIDVVLMLSWFISMFAGV